MSCHKPVPGFYVDHLTKTGRKSRLFLYDQYGGVFSESTTKHHSLWLSKQASAKQKLRSQGFSGIVGGYRPCKQCAGCRIDHSVKWAVRCTHEASFWPVNSFVTLTYSDVNRSSDCSLSVQSLQLFFKRLLKRHVGAGFQTIDGSFFNPIRRFACGEYSPVEMDAETGQIFGDREHYHCLIFNWRPDDLFLWKKGASGAVVYRSPELERLWPFGFSTIGDVNFQTAAYAARYSMKKVTGKNQKDFYGDRLPPFSNPSRRPGLGRLWIEKYADDVLKDGLLPLAHRPGHFVRAPAYYKNYLDEFRHDEYCSLMDRSGANFSDDYYHPDRVFAREISEMSGFSKLARNLYETE